MLSSAGNYFDSTVRFELTCACAIPVATESLRPLGYVEIGDGGRRRNRTVSAIAHRPLLSKQAPYQSGSLPCLVPASGIEPHLWLFRPAYAPAIPDREMAEGGRIELPAIRCAAAAFETVLSPARHPPGKRFNSFANLGTPPGTRTRRTWFLRPVRMPFRQRGAMKKLGRPSGFRTQRKTPFEDAAFTDFANGPYVVMVGWDGFEPPRR